MTHYDPYGRPEALYRAGSAWSDYIRRRPAHLACPHCGATQEARGHQCASSVQPRQQVVSDFLIASHAVVHGDRLLTRDRGYHGAYFPELKLG